MPNTYNYYPTGYSLTRCLLDLASHDDIENNIVLECCSGENHITDVLREKGYTVVTNDLNPNTEADYNFDVTEVSSWLSLNNAIFSKYGKPVGYVITNPPFSSDPEPGKKRGKPIAHEIFNLAMMFSTKGVSMLLRTSFEEPCDNRVGILKKYQPYLDTVINMPRYSFTGDGNTDNTSCNWYCYRHKGSLLNTKHEYVSKEDLCYWN